MIRWMTKLVKLTALAGFFFWELIISSARVAWDVLTPRAHRAPGIIAMPLSARTDAEIAWVANLITLTPGSLSLDVSTDRTTLYVHTLFADDPDAARRALKDGFERRVLELLR
ncbi:MAG: Na+/H+ antiporter subunit E [Proteobacteria bacterium]|nr:Na+/H+ antiporter subunit E [Pseudomonadota bacterium]